MIIKSPIHIKKRSRGPGRLGYDLVSFRTHTGMWNTGDNRCTITKTEYVKIKCATCKTKIRIYCNSNKNFLCAQNVMGSIFISVVTQTRELSLAPGGDSIICLLRSIKPFYAACLKYVLFTQSLWNRPLGSYYQLFIH